MLTLCYSGAFLLALSPGSAAHSAAPDSTAATHRHLLTLHTLRVNAPFLPALGYESQVHPRWSVRTSLSGQRNSLNYSYNTIDETGTIHGPISRRYRSTTLITDVSLNYYLQGSKPALVGWFVGAGLRSGLQRTRITDDGAVAFSPTFRALSVRPLLRAGRHWALGQRWLVDTHVGILVSSSSLERVIGVGVGYRL
ncbi:hypothetical protein [Hymenobacter sp. GOD-10R]|uniref:hypothetical protein n=1 Tax=Hymenobacter sp. GOD-10R TaxID=3093922 RepID=UPI002D7784E1|nr:hypothetical protein [Hymenobacter sp. GOD-10R]WRQ27680.1 hypothetical protein SD425_21650 [Hymenobacter sp. GOD-10R]